MTVGSISHSSPISPDLAATAPGTASKPAGNEAAKPGARPAIGGPLAGLASTGRAAKPAVSGSGPRPLGMAPQRLKIAGLPSGGKGAATRDVGTPPAAAHAPAPAPASFGAAKPASEAPQPAAPHHAAPAAEHDGGIAAMRAMSLETIAAQNALAQIQNQIALNQSKNSVREELGKGLKALAQ